MIKKGDWIIVDGHQRKKCFGIHTNGSYLIKNEGSLAQLLSLIHISEPTRPY